MKRSTECGLHGGKVGAERVFRGVEGYQGVVGIAWGGTALCDCNRLYSPLACLVTHHVKSYHIKSHCITSSRHVTSRHVASYHIALGHRTVLRRAASRNVPLLPRVPFCRLHLSSLSLLLLLLAASLCLFLLRITLLSRHITSGGSQAAARGCLRRRAAHGKPAAGA